MNTTDVTAIPGNTATDNASIQEISLEAIKPSKTNPRRRMDDAALAELAVNIKTHGVLQPILVRPATPGGYEIVCGERRWRASKTAGKDSILARIVNLSDAEALELAVIENVQREGVHELDEALGYRALMKQDPQQYTVETIAVKVGRPPRYIYGRLKLAELTPNLQTAFYEGKLTAAHAVEIARLQPKDQELALRECFPEQRSTAAILKAKNPPAISIHDLRGWIREQIYLSLANAPFDVNDANLVPAAGPCSTCLKRSGANPMLFADSIRRKDICTDRECFQGKVSAFLQSRVQEAEAAGEKPVKVSEFHQLYGQKPQPGVLYHPDYHEAKVAGECPTTVAGIVVEGHEIGRRLYVCTDKKCQTHAPQRLGMTPQEKAERKKQREALRIQQEYRKRLLEEVYKRVPAAPTRHELGLVALRYFEQLGHDGQNRISKYFAWEEKKANGKSGGYTDYPKLASPKLGAMTAAELGRFLIVCALASDLYCCPSYVSGAALPKDSRLGREAAHYKVNAERILRELKEKRGKDSAKQNGRSQIPSSRKANRTGKDG
jgi:ParB family transcriptional regulator, chromosome partitioning protein